MPAAILTDPIRPATRCSRIPCGGGPRYGPGVTSSSPPGPVAVSQPVAAPPEAVWWALTAGRAAWWPELVFDPVAGSPLVETWTEDGEVRSAAGEVVRCDAPVVLAFRWREPSWAHALEVTIRLDAAGPGTEVTLTESGFATAGTPPTLPAEHAEGWRYHLGRLRRVCETGSADPGARP